MHGLINRGLQRFVINIFGNDVWEETCIELGFSHTSFETMLSYDDLITEQILDTLCIKGNRTRATLLEDFGTFLVSENATKTVRRLLRLGGETYIDFLHSLEDVQDHVRVAIPDLEMPLLYLEMRQPNDYILRYEFAKCGFGAVFLGLLRGMADDYGALVTISHVSRCEGQIDKDVFRISVVEDNWGRLNGVVA